VGLFDWEDGDLLNSTQQIGWLAYCYPSLVGVDSSGKVLSRNGVAQDLRKLD
jgi:hypothetical protein